MRALGACVLGIGQYAYDASLGLPHLDYATADADGVETYLRACWRPDDAVIVRVPESEATDAALDHAFKALADQGPYDLLVLFLSGHGLADPDRTGFVVQPPEDRSVLRIFSPEHLDSQLGGIAARRTVVVLDCCYAEGVVRDMSFFKGLGADDARLFIASSRASQRTWEDERAGHGIFTAHLLDLLNTGSAAGLQGVRDQLDVDSELFPVLCQQVPLYVLERKNQQQEPVKGGVSINRISLPVARAARRLSSRTPFGTALRRVRQILMAAAAAGAALLVFAYAMVFYIEQDASGQVVLYHGTRWLAPVFHFLPRVRVETGLTDDDLSADDTSRHPITAGEAWGLWAPTSAQGYRAWYDVLRPALSPGAAQRYDVLLGAGVPPPGAILAMDARPASIEAAAWALLDGGATPAGVGDVLRHIPGADMPDDFDPNSLDFQILDLLPEDFESLGNALKSTALVDPVRAFPAYVGYLKATRAWLAQNTDAQRGPGKTDEVRNASADVLPVIAEARIDRGLQGMDRSMLSRLQYLAPRGYNDVIAPALSRVSLAGTAAQAAAQTALAAFHGDMNDPVQAAVLRTLRDGLDAAANCKAVVRAVQQRFSNGGSPSNSDLTRFLITAGRRSCLPPDIVAELVERARKAAASGAPEFEDVEVARVLAAGMVQVPVADRPVIYRLIELASVQIPRLSANAEIAMDLARQGLDTPTILQMVVSQAAAAGPYRRVDPSAIAGPLPGMAIISDRGLWVAALAAIGGKRQLPPSAIGILLGRAADPNLRDDVVKALAAQPSEYPFDVTTADLRRPLAQLAKDSERRNLLEEVMAQRLARVPRPVFLETVNRIRRARAKEEEPEVRIALGHLVIDATLIRGRTPKPGENLLD